MKSVIEILKIQADAMGWDLSPVALLKLNPIKIPPPSPGYMRLCIEAIGPGPRGMETISVAHYYEQNGDLCSDPEMTFEIPREGWDNPAYWGPTSFAMSGMAVYRECVTINGQDKIIADVSQVRDNIKFAKTWDRNIREQGFIDYFRKQKGGK